MKVTIFDYGAGNLHSLAKAIALVGIEPTIEADPISAVATDVLVLPGVGAFAPAAARLGPGRTAIRRALQGGLPCLGICLGMQLLQDASDEGAGAGLGVLPGRVTRLAAARLPQIGWNEVRWTGHPAERPGLELGYYANSYVCGVADPARVAGWSEYDGRRFPAAARVARTLGVQFHPEKSSTPGLDLIRAFLDGCRP